MVTNAGLVAVVIVGLVFLIAGLVVWNRAASGGGMVITAGAVLTLGTSVYGLAVLRPFVGRVYDEQIKIFTADGQFYPKALVVIRQSLVEMGILQQVPDDGVMFTTRFLPVKF